MNFSKKYISLVIISFVSIAFASSGYGKDNFFKRSANAVKEFFKGDSSSDEKDTPTTTNTETTEHKTDDNRPAISPAAELEQLYDNSLDENVHVPKLGNQKTKIREYQQVEAKKLLAAGEKVETMRNGEVIIATVPSDELFYPNDTVLKPTAGKHLRPYVRFLQTRDMYRVLLAMHSDDTGSAAYTDRLTMQRVLAVLAWFQENAQNSDYVIPYAMGASEPLYQNNSVTNREQNRRLEIYLVPGRTMVKAASSSKLTH